MCMCVHLCGVYRVFLAFLSCQIQHEGISNNSGLLLLGSLMTTFLSNNMENRSASNHMLPHLKSSRWIISIQMSWATPVSHHKVVSWNWRKQAAVPHRWHEMEGRAIPRCKTVLDIVIPKWSTEKDALSYFLLLFSIFKITWNFNAGSILVWVEW